MKKAIISIMVLSTLSGCYKDKGSYDYHLDQMNEIKTVSFIPATVNTIAGKTIELQQPLNEEQTTGHIEVQLEQTLASNFDNLDFFWYISYKKDDKQVKDTVQTKGSLDVPLAIGKETQYQVLLEIKDNSTKLSKFEKIVIQTRPIFKNSLFVLHGQPGNALLGNVETVGSETKVRTDAHAVAHPDAGNKPFKDAIGLVYAAYNNDYKTPSTRLAALYSDGSSQVYNPYGLNEVLWKNYVIPSNNKDPRPFTFKSFFTTGDSSNDTDTKCIISTDGRFYWSKHMIAFKVPGENANNPNHLTDYAVTTGTITEKYIVLWDQKNNRFICVSNQDDYFNYYEEKKAGDPGFRLFNPVLDAHVDFSTLEKQGLSPKGKEAIYAYIQYKENYEDSKAYFIFKDKSNNSYYLYELTSLGGDKDDKSLALLKDDGSEEGDNNPLFSITGKKLKDFNPNTGVYSVLYSTEFMSSYVFYAEGGNLYRYNTSNADKALIYQAPEGWNINILKLRSYDKSSFMGEDDDNLRQYICIGMNKGNEGAVTEIKLTTAGDIDETFNNNVYTQDESGAKFGNIMDLQFAHEYMYYVKDYQ